MHERGIEMKKLVKGVLVAVVAAALVFGMASCGGGGSPTAAAKGFMAAVEKGDAKAIEKYSSAETAALIAMFGEKAQTSIKDKGKVTDTSEVIDGDTAKVTFTFENGETDDIDLVKVDGKWKVSINK